MNVLNILQVDMRTNGECVAEWQGCNMMSKLGLIKCDSLTSVPIK